MWSWPDLFSRHSGRRAGKGLEKGSAGKGVRTVYIDRRPVLCQSLAMPRPLRPIADGLIYHVINRGNGRQSVFLGDGDYLAFLGAIADPKERKPFDLFGYCLMTKLVSG